jgi:hypothetical protein
VSGPVPSYPGADTSGVSWAELYHGVNHPRLQRVKARWDPTDFFRHPRSVRLPAAPGR